MLVDKAWRRPLAEDEDFKLRRTRRTSVKGYRHLEMWALRRPSDDSRPDLLAVPAARLLPERAQSLLRSVDEEETAGEGPVAPEGDQ